MNPLWPIGCSGCTLRFDPLRSPQARLTSPGAVRTEHRGLHAVTNPFQFLQQVRSEVAKIVWPTRREVMLTTIMVFIMATLTAIFFALVDLGIRGGLRGILAFFG